MYVICILALFITCWSTDRGRSTVCLRQTEFCSSISAKRTHISTTY